MGLYGSKFPIPKEYTDNGFSDPYIGDNKLCMTRPNKHIDVESETAANSVKYALNQYKTPNCFLNVQFSPNVISYIKNLSNTGSTDEWRW